MKLHKKMGYNYQIDVARFAEKVNRSEALSVEIFSSNIGVAPMHFDWDVQFALIDGSGNLMLKQEFDCDLT